MLKLSLSTSPQWIDLGMGVRVKVRPCTSAIFYHAKAFMQQRLQQPGDNYHAHQHSDTGTRDLPDLQDGLTREALAEQYLTIGLAIAGIIEWEGILSNDDDNSDDVTAAVTEENITQLFENYWVIAETFRQQYTGMRELLDSEKNGSRPACNGTQKAGRTTAPTVPNNACPARKEKRAKTVSNAPTSNTA